MSDQTALTTATQNLTKAQDHLAAATLTAPISGVVGSIGFAVGTAETPSNSITIVGSGAAEVSTEVPLAKLPAVEVGQAALVTPAGATESVVGSVTRVSLLPTAATAATASAGPTYAVVTLVPQATGALTTGSRAEVGIVIDHVDNVLTVPVSAVTTVATGTAIVQVAKDGTATRTTVQTGAVGQGLVQVLGGLSAGQALVIADLTQPLPDNSTQNLRRVTGAGSVGGAGGLGGPGGPGGGGAPQVPGGGGAARPGG
ncbi:MAG: efflux RND transporter periplasmic adaptor subunit [Lapillicoccus sp.]